MLVDWQANFISIVVLISGLSLSLSILHHNKPAIKNRLVG